MKQYLIFKVFLVLLLLAQGFTASASEATDRIRIQLEEMLESDQSIRKEMQTRQSELLPGSPELKALWEEQRKHDEENIKTLEAIIEKHGWPKSSEVGNKAASAAFLIIQHSDLEYQKKYLLLLKQAVAANEAKPTDLALLQDRVLMREGKNQIYGSQLRSEGDGPLKLWPIEDEANVDERRASVGLEPLADYIARFGIKYQNNQTTPKTVKVDPL